MMSLHHILIQLRNNLGYQRNDRGVCVLYAEKAVDAFLVGQYKTVFQKRCEWIAENHSEWPSLLQKARAETKALSLIKSTPAQESDSSICESSPKFTMIDSERNMVFEVSAFIDQGDLYQTPAKYSELFDRVLTQENPQEISVFAQSDALEQLGGRACMASFLGVYTEEKMLRFMGELNELARILRHDFAISLAGRIHHIALCYGEIKRSWYLIDANNPEVAPVSLFDAHAIKALSVQISHAVEVSAVKICAFQSYFFTTARQQPFLQETVNQWKQRSSWKALHDISPENARLSTKQGVSVAFLAARGGHVGIIKKLIRCGYSEHPDKIITTAAYHGSAEVLEVLLDRKNLNGSFMIDRNHKRAIIYMVAEQGHTESLKVIMKARSLNGSLVADINQLGDSGKSPALIAAQNGHAEILRLLLQEKHPNQRYVVDINQYHPNCGTLAYVAAKHGHIKVMQLLLELQHLPNAPHLNLDRVYKKRTAALIATEKGHIHILRLLMEAKRPNGRWVIDPTHHYKDGMTPLFLAAQLGHVNIVKYLLFTKKMSILPFFSSEQSLKKFASLYPESVGLKMNKLIECKLKAGQSLFRLQIMPNEIAAVMGHQEVVDQFQQFLVAQVGLFSELNKKRYGNGDDSGEKPKRLKMGLG